MVKAEELQERANATCQKLGLAACDVMIYIKMDDCVGIIGDGDFPLIMSNSLNEFPINHVQAEI